ncbi:MAG TPA: winged helix-turn-helix transcriptional regulator [Solirubrobacterales bacterium]
MEIGGSGEVGSEGRAGALALSLLATPHNREILDELSRGPRRLSELRRLSGSPPQTTLRARLEQLGEMGVVTRRKLNLFPSVREYELTGPPGRELLFVATTVDGWLASAPEEPLTFSSEGGRVALMALAESWSSTLLQTLAAEPGKPMDLDRGAGRHGRVALERQLDQLRAAGLIAGGEGEGGRKSYEISDWLRKGTGPIAAAARWERRHVPHAVPLNPIDAEAGFLLAMPLLKPPLDLAGSCRLGIEFGSGRERRLAGVTVEVGGGRVISCTTRLETCPAAWATGPPEAWLRTTIEANPNRLELGGDRRLVRGLIDGLNQALFGPARPLPPQQ